jgi:hypothetical protein
MSRYPIALLLACLPMIAAPGCGESVQTSFVGMRDGAPTVAQEAPTVAGARQEGAARPEGTDKPGNEPGKPAIDRKIIYNATVEVIVKDLDDALIRVERLVEETGGYIARSERVGDTGTRRTATWVLKIPSEKFRSTVAALANLGIPVRNTSDSQDVTEEFLDLQARIKNLKTEEEALNKLLRESATLDAILKIRAEITRIRGDIERAEGRLKYLATMSALSTITFIAREDVSYVPPTIPEPPSFLSRVADTFNRSFKSLRIFVETLGLIVVALTPWLPVIVIFAWLIRRLGIRIFSQSVPERPRRALPIAHPVEPELQTQESTSSDGRNGDSPNPSSVAT